MSNEEQLYPDAQKCAWCSRYLMYGQKFAVYDGKDLRYQGWTCHALCNINSHETDDTEDSASTKSNDSTCISIYEVEP